MTIFEGKNRQIRRMFESLGLEVARLRRTAVGPIKLGMLPPGKWRKLTPSEVSALKNAVRQTPEDPPAERGGRGGSFTLTNRNKKR
jgi:23S rRNA pseudouridine2605 synthase